MEKIVKSNVPLTPHMFGETSDVTQQITERLDGVTQPLLILENEVHDLNESNFDALLPKVQPNTLIAIPTGHIPGEQLMQQIKNNNLTVFCKNCEAGDLQGYASVSPKGKFVAVKHISPHLEHMLVLTDGEPLAQDSVEKPDDAQDQVEQPEENDAQDQVEENDAQVEQPEENDAQDQVEENDAQVEQPEENDAQDQVEQPEENAEPYIEANDPLCRLKSFALETEYLSQVFEPEEHHSIVTFETHMKSSRLSYCNNSPTSEKASDRLNKKFKKGQLKAFSTIHVSMYATDKTTREGKEHSASPHKWIKFQLFDSVGMTAKMGSNDNRAKGFFNYSADIYLFPGTGCDPRRKDIQPYELPAGWSRPYIEPQGPNESETYTCTTGWGFDVTCGGSADGAKATATATYNRSNAVTKKKDNFEVSSISDGIMSGWTFKYTHVDENAWKGHFEGAKYATKAIAPLAKTTIHFNTEAVYQAPYNSSDEIQWNFCLYLKWAALSGNLGIASRRIYYKEVPCLHVPMKIDIGKVQLRPKN